MKTKILTTVSNIEHPGLKSLEASLKMFNIDYHIIHDTSIGWDWGGWRNVYEYCKKLKETDYTHIVYTDGFDTLAFTGIEEINQKMAKLLEKNPNGLIYSVEKHFFPHEGTDVAPKDWVAYYNLFNEREDIKALSPNHRWRYVNGGQYAGSIDAVMKWFEDAARTRNNQSYANAYYSEQTDNRLILDFNCELFQAISHSGKHHGAEDEFSTLNEITTEPIWENNLSDRADVKITSRLQNNLTKSFPCFGHANGIKNPEESKWMYDILGL